MNDSIHHIDHLMTEELRRQRRNRRLKILASLGMILGTPLMMMGPNSMIVGMIGMGLFGIGFTLFVLARLRE